MSKSSKKTAATAARKPAAAKPAAAKPKAPAARAAKKPATKPAAKAEAKKAATNKSDAKAPAAAVEPKARKSKTIRDSFNMPEFDYALIGVLKKRALAAATEVKKSELLRAGLKALAAMTDKDFATALKAVHVVKTGRPGKKK